MENLHFTSVAFDLFSLSLQFLCYWRWQISAFFWFVFFFLWIRFCLYVNCLNHNESLSLLLEKKASLDLWPAIQNQYQILPYIEHVDFGTLSLGEEVWQTMFKNRWVCVSLRHMLLFTQGVRESSKGGEFWPICKGKRKMWELKKNLVNSVVWQFATWMKRTQQAFSYLIWLRVSKGDVS